MLFGLGWPQWLTIIALVGGLLLTFRMMAKASVRYEAARKAREEQGSAGRDLQEEQGSAGRDLQEERERQAALEGRETREERQS